MASDATVMGSEWERHHCGPSLKHHWGITSELELTGHSDGLPKTAIGLNLYKNFNFSLIRRRSSEITASTSDRDGCTKFNHPMSHWLCYNVKTCQPLPIASIYLTWPLPVSIEGVVTSCSEAACSEGRPLQATM